MDKNLGKARITITLRTDILPLLDRFIDGEKIRNRSHAIEYILGQHLGLGIEKAVVLAGSDKHGTVPALAVIQHRPAIGYILDRLHQQGVRDVILVIDTKGHSLQEYVGDGSQWKMRVQYVVDTESCGTAHALSLVQPLVSQTFLLIYSDALADLNLGDFVEHHKQYEAGVGTVALTYKRSIEEYGVARLEGSAIVEYLEKPGKESKHGLVNSGIYLFEPGIFEYITAEAKSLEKDILPQVAKKGKLYGYPFQGLWFDLSKESGRAAAEAEWQ